MDKIKTKELNTTPVIPGKIETLITLFAVSILLFFPYYQ